MKFTLTHGIPLEDELQIDVEKWQQNVWCLTTKATRHW